MVGTQGKISDHRLGVLHSLGIFHSAAKVFVGTYYTKTKPIEAGIT